MTARARIDDGGEVPREVVGVATEITNGKCKRNFQSNLGGPDEFPVAPGLTVNRDFSTGGNCIQERLTIASEVRIKCCHAGEQ